MRNDLADYARMGRRPGGLRLASLRGPCSTDNFWTTTLVSLRYLLGLTLTHSIVTRIPPVSSTSAPSPKSRARSHFSLLTLLPRFPLFLPFVFLDPFFFYPVPITNCYQSAPLPWPYDDVSMRRADAQLWYLVITYASYFTHWAVISSIKCTLNGLGISIQLFLFSSAQVQSPFLIFSTYTFSPLHAQQSVTHHIKLLYSFQLSQSLNGFT